MGYFFDPTPRDRVWRVLDCVANRVRMSESDLEAFDRLVARWPEEDSDPDILGPHSRGLWRAYHARGGADDMRRSRSRRLREMAAEFDSEAALAAIDAILNQKH